MHRIRHDLDLTAIVGRDLNLLGMGRYDVQLNFIGSGITFCIQGDMSLFEGDEVIATWNEQDNWSSLSFQKLLNATVASYEISNDRCLKIVFENGLTLCMHDNSDHFESMQIYFDDKNKSVEVI